MWYDWRIHRELKRSTRSKAGGLTFKPSWKALLVSGVILFVAHLAATLYGGEAFKSAGGFWPYYLNSLKIWAILMSVVFLFVLFVFEPVRMIEGIFGWLKRSFSRLVGLLTGYNK